MNMTAKWLLLVMASTFSAGVFADDYTCPPSLEVQEKLVSTPADWSGMYEKASGETAYIDGNEISDTVKLLEVTLYSGEPKAQALLAPDNADSLSEEEESDSLWAFKSADDQKKQPLYVACNYEGSGISVFRKITAPVKSCSWHFKPDAVNNILTCIPY
jgi:hypothetical protein